MKTRNTLGVVGILALTLTQVRSEPVAVNGTVYELAPEVAEQFETWRKQFDGVAPSERRSVLLKALESEFGPEKVRIIANPRVVVQTGSWAFLDMAREITYPGDYDPATVPKASAGKVHGGGNILDKGQPKLKTNDSGVPTPPHPKDFEERDLGLMMKVSPQVDGSGNISVECQVKQTALVGFINYGTPITMDKPGALRKNAKPIEWLENQILLPTFCASQESFKVSSSGDGLHLIDPNATAVPQSPKPDYSDFGAEFSEAKLPALLFVVSAERLSLGLKSLPSTDPGTAPAKTRSWPLNQQTRNSLGLKSEQPGPEASTEFSTRLTEFGVRVRDIKTDPEWNFEVTATAEMIERIDNLISVYEARPEILLSSKFLEIDFPIGPLDNPIMTDPELQVFFREMNQKKGVDLLSAPSIMMRPLQDGKVEVLREFIYPTVYNPPESQPAKKQEAQEASSFPITPATPTDFKIRNVGVELALKTRLFEDGSIELEINPEVSEFLGFLNFGQPISIPQKGPLGKTHMVVMSENRMEMPVFNRRSLSTRVRIPDGASVLVGGLVKTDVQQVEDKIPILGDLPIIGRLARSNTQIEFSRYVYFVVSATVQKSPSVAKTE